MERTLTGLKPTGDLTLGNYIGAIKQMVQMQDKYEQFIFVADLHALTIYQDPKELHERIKKFIAMYLACGLDPKKNTIYIQSENEYIPAMTFALECTTYYGEASRMIQFKEKSKEHTNFSVGLLTYPVLMASDILYADIDYVPVGIDQKQHVELAEIIAERFNSKYGETFKVPKPLITKTGTKINDLKNPLKKMSKSEESPMGVISLFDDPELAYEKILKATTDSDNQIKYDPKNKPGISNLLNIASSLTGEDISLIEKDFEGKSYKEFKEYVGNIVKKALEDIQSKYNKIINSGEVEQILNEGIIKSRELAKKKYDLIKQRMGLYR